MSRVPQNEGSMDTLYFTIKLGERVQNLMDRALCFHAFGRQTERSYIYGDMLALFTIKNNKLMLFVYNQRSGGQ